MRALVVTNMYPTPERPALGSFVRDQVEALRRREDVEIDLFAFPPGLRAYPRAARELRRRTAASGSTSSTPTSASPRGRRSPRGSARSWSRCTATTCSTRARTASPRDPAVHGAPAAVSREFSELLRGAGTTRRVAVLPVGIDLERFRPISRREARERLGLDPGGRYLLFPHDPARPLKRFDRAQEAAAGTTLLTMGNVAPADVPLWINACNAVLVPSQAEGFGLSVIEALACGVPAFGTPVGIHPVALADVGGAYCAPWDREAWRAALRPVLEAEDPRVDGRDRAAIFSADRMAARVVEAWRDVAG